MLNEDPVGNEIVVLETVEPIHFASDKEVESALVWVECAEEISYFDRLGETYDNERSWIIEKYEPETFGLAEKAEMLESLIVN